MQPVLPFARIRDGLLPGRRIRHAFPLLGPAVGDLIVLLGGEHRPHDRLTAVDILRHGTRIDLDVRALDLASAEAHGGLGARGDGRDRGTAAGAALTDDPTSLVGLPLIALSALLRDAGFDVLG